MWMGYTGKHRVQHAAPRCAVVQNMLLVRQYVLGVVACKCSETSSAIFLCAKHVPCCDKRCSTKLMFLMHYFSQYPLLD